MGLTPTKSRSKKPAVPAEPPFKVIDERRRAWLALLPPTVDLVSLYTEDREEAVSLGWNVAGCARQFMEWTHFSPDTWEAPAWYGERLARMCAWLQAQPAAELPYRREDALKILLAAWPRHLEHLKDGELIFDTIPSLYTPEDLAEFGPLDMPLPYLPHWRVPLTPEQEAALMQDGHHARLEAAKTAEEFTLYAGLVTWLNTRIGLPLLDLEPNPF